MNLTENIYEDAFSQLMIILMTQNSEIFDMITCAQAAFEFRGHKFDLSNMTECWKIWCTQNLHKVSPKE